MRERQNHILQRIRSDGVVRVADLTAELGVSDMTIRRDLKSLARRGLLEKVHGGAVALVDSSSYEPGFAAKTALQRVEKEAIAAAAAQMIEPGSTIGISAGTTTHALARRLIDVPGLTIVTNSVPAAETLHRHGRDVNTVMLLGGLRTPSEALVGPFALAALREVNLDTVFLGVHGIDMRAGLTTPNQLEADTDRALIGAARRLVVLADATKFGVIGIASIAPLSDVSTLITDASVEPADRRAVEGLVGELVVTHPYDPGRSV